MEITLDKLKAGQSGYITGVVGQSATLTRLMEMGLVTGTAVRMERISPFGCPIAIRVKGCSIAMRREDALQVSLSLDPQTV